MILIFDFDGTLHPTDAIYGYAVRKVLRELPFPVPEEKQTISDQELSRYLGVNADEMWADFLPQLPTSERKDVIARVGSYMIDGINNDASHLYEGIPEVLTKLKEQGHTLLILSNCTRKYKQAQWTAHHLEQWFSDYYCTEDYDNSPKEDIFPKIKKKYSGEYVMIGDRYLDLKVAQTHKIHFIGCLYGYGKKDELTNAGKRVDHPSQIPDIISCF